MLRIAKILAGSAFGGPDTGEVCDPPLVGRLGRELAVATGAGLLRKRMTRDAIVTFATILAACVIAMAATCVLVSTAQPPVGRGDAELAIAIRLTRCCGVVETSNLTLGRRRG